MIHPLIESVTTLLAYTIIVLVVCAGVAAGTQRLAGTLRELIQGS